MDNIELETFLKYFCKIVIKNNNYSLGIADDV